MLIGVDFSSAPTRRKPIVVAQGLLRGAVLQLQRFERFETLPAFGAWLQATPAWTGGFDLPFGLPRRSAALAALAERITPRMSPDRVCAPSGASGRQGARLTARPRSVGIGL